MVDLPRTMPALITPFDGSGTIDDAAHRHNVALLAERGARGVLVGGSTGQGPYLEPGERSRLVAAARDAAEGIAVVCGVFGESLRMAGSQVAEAASAGAAAALVVTPGTLVRRSPEALPSFFRALADGSDIPVLLYTVPQVTGIELSVDAVAELAAHPSIVGIKDSGGDAARFASWRDLSAFTTFCGASPALADAHRNGTDGAITASANYTLTDVSLAVRGDADAQRRLTAMTSVVEAHGVAGTMVASEAAGLVAGTPRAPLERPDPEIAQRISDAVTARGLGAPQPQGHR